MVEQWLLTLDLERAKTSFRRYEEDDKVKVAVAKRLKELGLTKEEAYMTPSNQVVRHVVFRGERAKLEQFGEECMGGVDDGSWEWELKKK